MPATSATVTPGERATGWQVIKLLWSSSRSLSFAVLVWLLMSSAMPALVVVMLGILVGAVPDAVRQGMQSQAGHHLIDTLGTAAVVYGLSLALDPIGSALGTISKARITGDLQVRLMTAVSAPIGMSHLENPEVLDRIANAEGKLTGFFPGDAPVTWAGILANRLSGLIGCAIVSFYVWWLGMLLLGIWLLARRYVLVAVLRQTTDLRGQTTAMRRAWYMAGVGTKVRDAKEVRVYSLADFVADQFCDEYRTAMRAGDEGLRNLHRRASLGFLLVLAGCTLAITVIIYKAYIHALDLRAMAILLPMLTVTMSAGSISFDDITLNWTLAGLPDIGRLESQLGADITDLTGSTNVSGLPSHSLRFENVHFRYPGSQTDVLKGVDLEFKAGTSIAIVGLNGAGKSTLVSLLSRLRDPSDGRITVDTIDLCNMAPVPWQRNVAIMLQEPVRYPFSAYDNIALGSVEYRNDRSGVEQAARIAGFDDVVKLLPNQWETILSSELPGGVDMSGGQWQRLALARALFATYHGARILILDEPTAALDIRSEAKFYQRFFEITKGITTVVISHRFATVRLADKICVLEGGRITQCGNHEALLAEGGTYAQMYELQARPFGGTL